ncbi:CPBP family intramembrane metalloprotease [Sediminibacillus dalangtanensis]|uniref:CPBP family intramembrane metalloprotease n=1 Tax=Sediminibacillus dalangtanensis TaxID=2729421 RepID=A0ABX7VNI5_9BACI|nr:type II CAAX endopeptidase family protein [Sediminibacillus dalangtanensis]QTM98146.1 CPBP family intramembrane metalloprotease [Sediminibacillus dalangtanensis]
MPKRYWYVIMTYIIMQLSGAFLVPFIDMLNIDRFTFSVSWSIISFVAALVITLLLLRPDMRQGSDRNASGAGGIIGWSALGVAMAYMAQYAAVIIETMVLGIKPGSENTMQIMEIARAAPIFIIIPTIIAPILEEIIFRKIIFGSLYKRMNFFIAALASSIIFGLVHMDVTHIITYTGMGLVFAFLYVHTNRIIVPIITHMAMNTITVIAQFSIDPEELDQMLEQWEKMQMILIGG